MIDSDNPKTQVYSIRQANEFKRIFKRELREFWISRNLGFNIIKFDEQIIKSGNQVMREAIQQSYGTDGTKLIAELIGAN